MCTPISSYNKFGSSVTAPKPILKKSPSNSRPLFFSGNESYSDNMGSLTLASQTRINFNMNQFIADEVQQEHDNRFNSSLLNSPDELNVNNTLKKRIASDVYIFHSIEINREIIKSLLTSIETFLDEFKEKFACEYFNDRDLLLTHKQQLLPVLRSFLMMSRSCRNPEASTENGHIFEIGATLSEPNILNIKQLRAMNDREHLAHSNSASTMSKKKLNDEMMCGSLPNRSCMDMYTKELEMSSLKPQDNSTKLEELSKSQLSVNQAKTDLNIVKTARANKKMVRFADAFGFDLEKVKIISNNNFVDMFTESNYFAEQINNSEKPVVNSSPLVILIPLFGLRKVDQSSPVNIRLDNYVFDYENKMIRCMVRVRNLSFKKRVFARITFNNWKSSFDLNAIYVKSENFTIQLRNQTNSPADAHPNHPTSSAPCSNDFFSFCIIIPDKNSILQNKENINRQASAADEFSLRIEFALCYETPSNTYWDNNLGQNYKFQCFFNRTS